MPAVEEVAVAKTVPSQKLEVEGVDVHTNALPDVFDERDLDYRAMLTMLPAVRDWRPKSKYVLTQEGQSCTGHAVAAMINAVLDKGPDPVKVSPYMLYAFARRYDEFPGTEDAGSSLRGVLKGWYYHGVLPEESWPKQASGPEPDLDNDVAMAAEALARPLGAFYRVNSYRLDDMQSAINELYGIVASAAIHDGWLEPAEMTNDQGKTMMVIQRSPTSEDLGGHAFALVGYNEVGFLVQNSWGTKWGDGGFATLPYDDWLETAFDAWVVRPGVRSIVSSRNRTRTAVLTGGALGEQPGPDLTKLNSHVVNLGNNGMLSKHGRFVSTPAQIQGIFASMESYHSNWLDPKLSGSSFPPRIVLYAHGGLNSEDVGLGIAQKHLNWWLNNRIYPITFAWETGAFETLMDEIYDHVRRWIPFGGIREGFIEQLDQRVERAVQDKLRWAWEEMKQNAAAASATIEAPIDWTLPAQEIKRLEGLPGATVIVSRLAKYLAEAPGDTPPDVHLVGHSAGSIFLTDMLARLAEANIPVESMTFLAPAIRTDDWIELALPALQARRVRRFTSFGMQDKRELDDTCDFAGHSVYHKSLLYLVSQAFEPKKGDPNVALVGMQRYEATELDGTSLKASVEALPDAKLIWAPHDAPVSERSDSHSHGGFDDDSATMTSTLLRILRQTEVQERNVYVADAQRVDPEPQGGVQVIAAFELPSQAAAEEVADQVDAVQLAAQRTTARRSTKKATGKKTAKKAPAKKATKRAAAKRTTAKEPLRMATTPRKALTPTQRAATAKPQVQAVRAMEQRGWKQTS
jgi:pimeloyl-ACP methyl ester carboxylesterase